MKKVNLRLQGKKQYYNGYVNLKENVIDINQRLFELHELTYDVPVEGQVYGTLLNMENAYDQLKPKMNEKPYLKPPEAPVLYIKPVNTYCSHRFEITLPEDEKKLSVGGTLGVVIGEDATKVPKQDAFDYIEGYTIVNDISIPHDSFYRPAIKERAQDNFCAIGPWVVKKDSINNPNELLINISVNDELKLTTSTKHLIRNIETLIEDVTSYMTLYAGDMLLVGVDADMPHVSSGDKVSIEIEGIGKLENIFKGEN